MVQPTINIVQCPIFPLANYTENDNVKDFEKDRMAIAILIKLLKVCEDFVKREANGSVSVEFRNRPRPGGNVLLCSSLSKQHN